MPKSQEELEKPAKRYEIESVVTQVTALTGIVEKLETSTNIGFEKINVKLDKGFNGLATTSYVDDEICKAKAEILEKVNDKYGATNKGVDKFKWIVISGLIGIAMQIVAFFALGGIK